MKESHPIESSLSGLHPIQIKIYREMDPERKIEIAMDLLMTGREMVRAGVRSRQPDLSREEIDKKVKRIFWLGTG